MGQLEGHVNLAVLLELEPREIGDFCDGALNAEILVDELEHDGPFAPFGRKSLCEFLGIGESTLTGWLKAERVPRAAKVAYVLLVGVIKLQSEIKRLSQEGQDPKILRDGEKFQLVRFETDETGVSVGKIVAREISDMKAARVLAGSLKAFRMLQETRDLIGDMLERTDNSRYIKYLEDFDLRIRAEMFTAFEPERLFDFSDLIDEQTASNAN